MSFFRPFRSLLSTPTRLSTTPISRACSSCSRSGIASTLFSGGPSIPCPAARTTSAGPARGGPIGMAVTMGAQRGMKVRSSVKKLCDGCSVVKRKGYLYVVCSKDPKHKQRQG